MTLFKNLLSFCFTFFFCNTFVWGQCPQGDVILETQLEVDNFAADYPFCTEITETLNIGVLWNDSDIIDLSNLPPIESIGNLDIRRNPALTALSGLENLTSISGYLRINDNDALTDLSGLENLTSISGYLSIAKNDALTDLSTFENLTSISRLTISDNDGLTDLSGFENLTSIGGDLWITYNDGLTDLSGLENLISIDNELRIYENANLTDLSRLENLDSIGGNLDIEYNGALTTLNAFENLTSIGGELSIRYNDALTDLNAFENLTSISDDLGIWDNDILTDLSAFENLTSIGGDLRIIESDGLTDLSGLENLTSIGNLVIHRNDALTDLSALENLTSIDGKLSILINNALTDLSGFENLTSIGELTIQGNDALTDLSGLENLTSIGEGLIIWGNNALTDLSGFENLTSIDGNLSIIINNVLTDLSAFENLTSIGGNLRIESNGGLTDLSALGNLTSFDGELSIYDNSALSICEVPFICAYLYDGGISSIYDNAPGCSSVVEILNACSFIPKVYADVFYDLNQNGTKEANELNYYDVSISIMPGGIFYLQNTGIIFIESGTYTATFDTINNPNWQLTTMPSSYTFSLDEGETDTITFGMYPTQEISHIQTIINSPPVRCNETIIFDVTTKNIGTTIANGTTWFTIDDAVPAFNFIDEPDTLIVVLDTYGWYFTDLYPGQSITKNVEITVPGPPDFEIGEQLLFVSFSEFIDANGEDGSEGFRYNPTILCSYDPNDKLVNPNREGDYVLFEEDLIYTVRFQNTGNDVAYDVVIRDTLDANLDLSTFRVLGSSHANRLNTILNEDEGILTFEFRDIFLPDSTSNLEGSQGYVNYLIRTNEGLAEETPVTNSAGIYFDLNPPIITNTTQSIMVSELPTEAHCPSGDVILETQEEVEDFVFFYPDCTEIYGSLQIGSNDEESDISDISILSQITAVEENLHIIDNPDLTNLSGLKNIVSIGGFLGITENDSLTNLSGLGNVQTIGEYLRIWDNDGLVNLSGIENLTSIGTYLTIVDNDNLLALNGLSGLENLPSSGNSISISSNASLMNLSGLDNLSYIGSSFSIENNSSLINLSGLDNLTSIGSGFSISANANLMNLSGLESLTSTGNYLEIVYNDNLMNLNGTENLTSTGIYLSIHNNNNLSDLSSLGNVTSGVNIEIKHNANLMSLTGLENIAYNSIMDLNIYENSVLSVCSLPNICNYLANGGLSDIYNNAPNCNSAEQVTVLCTVPSTTPDELLQIIILPNPTNATFTIQNIPKGTYQILNTSGQIIEEGNMQNDLLIDISQEAQGVYFISITIDNETFVRRIVKM